MRQAIRRLLFALLAPARRALTDARWRAAFDLNRGPPMDVEVEADPAALDAMWQHTAEVWSDLGRREPLWSVLTHPQYRTMAAPSPQRLATFRASGRGDSEYLESFLARAGLSPRQFPVVAEYGCGVGRTTRWLAERFDTVRAFDISAPHIALAEDYLGGEGLSNVHLFQLRGRADLAQLSGVDLFFSIIVLQHNPPPMIRDILDHAFTGLNRGGVAFFQVPTYTPGYRFELADYWARVAARRAMEIHFLPQPEIFRLASQHGLRVLEVRNDHCLGQPESAISNTFLMRKD